MKKFFISVVSLMMVGLNGYAQETTTTFKPSGKPVVTIFSDFRANVYDGKTNPAFEISRAYFGYVYNFSPNFSTKVLLDVSNKDGLQPSSYTAYIKNAFGEYSKDGLKIDFGMIGTNIFNLQESLWGKRYLLKSFQDLNGYGSSADLGLGIKYQFTPEFSADAQVVNGEGYQKVQNDSAVKVSLGLTYQPIKNLYVRVYGDYLKKKEAQTTFNAMVAYKDDKLTLAGELDLQSGHGKVKDHNLTGMSFWGAYKASSNLAVFGRFDNLSSKKLNGAAEGWNSGEGAGRDGNLYAVGLEYLPVKGVSISPNVQISDPKASGCKTTTSYLVNFNFSI